MTGHNRENFLPRDQEHVRRNFWQPRILDLMASAHVTSENADERERKCRGSASAEDELLDLNQWASLFGMGFNVRHELSEETGVLIKVDILGLAEF